MNSTIYLHHCYLYEYVEIDKQLERLNERVINEHTSLSDYIHTCIYMEAVEHLIIIFELIF